MYKRQVLLPKGESTILVQGVNNGKTVQDAMKICFQPFPNIAAGDELAQREAKLQAEFENMADLTHRILSLNEKILNHNRAIKGKKTSAWSFLCRLFRKES